MLFTNLALIFIFFRSNRFKRILGLANIRSVLLPSVKQWYHQFSPSKLHLFYYIIENLHSIANQHWMLFFPGFVRVDEYVPQYGRRHPRAANFPQLTDDKVNWIWLGEGKKLCYLKDLSLFRMLLRNMAGLSRKSRF